MFRKYVRKFSKNLLTFENMFCIIQINEQVFTNIYSNYMFVERDEITMDERVYEAFLNSEYRKQRNKMKRLRHFRRQCFLVLLTVLLILFLTVSYHAILSKATSNEPVSYKYYTSIEIVYGDSLWSIADRYAGEEYAAKDDYVHEVMKINHLQEESLIAGQYLVIPYYSTEFKQ